MMRTGRRSLGQWVFRWRSYLPLVAVAALAYGAYRTGPTSLVRAGVVGGSILAAMGLALRIYAVGQAPTGTSGRHRWQYAATLNTFGVYSIVRHPLYLGNILIWVGVSLTSGWPAGALASAALGALVFGLIVRYEDDFLRRSFPDEFPEWARVTPAFVPRLRLWRPTRRPFDWGRALASEYSSLHTIGLLILIFAALRGWSSEPRTGPSVGWWALLVANSALYLVLRGWRARRQRTGERGAGPGASRGPGAEDGGEGSESD